MWGARNMPAPPYDGFRRSKKHVFRRMRQGTFSLLGRGGYFGAKKSPNFAIRAYQVCVEAIL